MSVTFFFAEKTVQTNSSVCFVGKSVVEVICTVSGVGSMVLGGVIERKEEDFEGICPFFLSFPRTRIGIQGSSYKKFRVMLVCKFKFGSYEPILFSKI